jgi:hypothetical protein
MITIITNESLVKNLNLPILNKYIFFIRIEINLYVKIVKHFVSYANLTILNVMYKRLLEIHRRACNFI